MKIEHSLTELNFSQLSEQEEARLIGGKTGAARDETISIGEEEVPL